MLRWSSNSNLLPSSLYLSAFLVVLQTFLTLSQRNLFFVESAAWVYAPKCEDILLPGETINSKFCSKGWGFTPSPCVTENVVDYCGTFGWEVTLYDDADADGDIKDGSLSVNVKVDIDNPYENCVITVDDVVCSSCSICESEKVSANCTNIANGANVPCQSIPVGSESSLTSYGVISPLLPFTWQALPKTESDSSTESSSSTEPIPQCFSSEVTLLAKGKGKVKITEIDVGDQVLAEEGNFHTVYSIDHQHTSKPAHFLQFFCSRDEEPLELTARHMLFLEGEMEPIPASRIKVGEKLRTLQGSCFVNKILDITRKGVYNVLTSSGTIVANGIVSSTYSATFNNDDGLIDIIGYKVMTQQQLFRMLLQPYSKICNVISPTYCTAPGNDERVAIGQLAMQFLKHWLVQTEVQQIFSLCFISGIAFMLDILFNSWILLSAITLFLLLLQWEVHNEKNTKKNANSK